MADMGAHCCHSVFAPIEDNLDKQAVFLHAAAASITVLLCHPYQGREEQRRLM